MLKLKSLETENQVHLLVNEDKNGKLQLLISAVADGLLYYKFNSGEWV
jgi:hypothetical protein